jgi:hypothetical protein
MVMGPEGPGTENDCAGEDQQEFPRNRDMNPECGNCNVCQNVGKP